MGVSDSVLDYVAQIRDLIAAVRSNNWVQAVKLALKLASSLADDFLSDGMRASAPDVSDLDAFQIADRLEEAIAPRGEHEVAIGLSPIWLELALMLLKRLLDRKTVA